TMPPDTATPNSTPHRPASSITSPSATATAMVKCQATDQARHRLIAVTAANTPNRPAMTMTAVRSEPVRMFVTAGNRQVAAMMAVRIRTVVGMGSGPPPPYMWGSVTYRRMPAPPPVPHRPNRARYCQLPDREEASRTGPPPPPPAGTVTP